MTFNFQSPPEQATFITYFITYCIILQLKSNIMCADVYEDVYVKFIIILHLQNFIIFRTT